MGRVACEQETAKRRSGPLLHAAFAESSWSGSRCRRPSGARDLPGQGQAPPALPLLRHRVRHYRETQRGAGQGGPRGNKPDEGLERGESCLSVDMGAEDAW